jgi:hypothetical protein
MNASDVFIVVLVASFVTFALLAFYKYVINPQIVIPHGRGNVCPLLWEFNQNNGLCEPRYMTICQPFDPKTPTLESPDAKCNLAHTCGTDWEGNCP